MSELYKPNYGHIIFAKDLKSLIDNYDSFEERVTNDVVKSVISYFSGVASNTKGERFEINDIQYVIKYTFDAIERKYTVAILIDDVGRRYETLTITNEINQFGRIRGFEILYPKGLTKHASLLMTIVADQIKYAYSSYETVFKSKFDEYENNVIKNLYERVEIELLRQNKDELQKKFWITLTKLSSKEKDMFLFFLDANTISSTIDVIKKNQTNLYSPFEILECLLFEEAPDAGLEFFNQNITDITIEFKKQLKYGKKNNKYLNSQRILFNDTSFGFTYICNNKDLLLAINYPKKYSTDFKELIAQIKDDLTDVFMDNLNNHKIDFKFSSKKKSHLSKIYNETKDFIATVIAKAIKEFSKLHKNGCQHGVLYKCGWTL